MVTEVGSLLFDSAGRGYERRIGQVFVRGE